MRIFIAGGGTGGHIIPALAIADELKKDYAAEVRFIGTPRGLESRLVPQAGYPLEMIAVGQLKNVSLRTRISTVTALPRSIFHCRRLFNEWKPDAVVGVGGYASGPAMMAAVLSRIPTLAFEPNAAPGLANRLVGKWVSAAAVNFPPAAKFFRNAKVTGIPVRPEFFALPSRPPGRPPHLLVFGGSQGARALNERMPEIVLELLEQVPGLTILHQAGARHAEAVQAAYTASGAPSDRWTVSAFLDDMASRFADADVILARSGASTVAELAAAGKPSLLVPFPAAADDHQTRNAEVLADAGAAVLMPEREMTAERLPAILIGMLRSPERLQEMGARARTLAHPDAGQTIAAMVAGIAGAKKTG
jgi:UDP-N-acetylglucosamine--N-acetylmuramyl-(pentapeptide) pyrophosphoryl-undecaprenol N-acetylglucosamine transferase